MEPARASALTALRASSTRLAVSSQNVANARTGTALKDTAKIPEGVYKPLAVAQSSLELGGVRVTVKELDREPFIEHDDASETGLAAFPAVNYAEEAVNQAVALTSYKAAAAILRTREEMDDPLLDVKA